jgi:hypothetical protein
MFLLVEEVVNKSGGRLREPGRWTSPGRLVQPGLKLLDDLSG